MMLRPAPVRNPRRLVLNTLTVNTSSTFPTSTTTPTPTSGSGTITTASSSVNCTRIGNRCFFNATVSITTNGAGAGNIQLTLPFTAATTTAVYGTDNGLTLALTGHVTGSTLVFVNYDGTYPGADGAVLRIAGQFTV